MEYVTLHSGDRSISVYLQTPTMLKYAEFENWSSRINERAISDQTFERGTKFMEMAKKYPLVRELLADASQLREDAIQEEIQRVTKQGITEESAREQAVKNLQEKIALFASQNKEVFYILYAQPYEYPQSYQNVLLAIDLIRATCDPKKLNDADRVLILDANSKVVEDAQKALDKALKAFEKLQASLEGKDASDDDKKKFVDLNNKVKECQTAFDVAPYNTEFWSGVEWEGVCEYASAFRKVYKRN